MAKMMNGMVSMAMAEDLLLMVNGHFFRGCGRLIHHFCHRPKLNLNPDKRRSNCGKQLYKIGSNSQQGKEACPHETILLAVP